MRRFTKVWTIIALTFRESLAKKTFVVFFALSTITHLFFLLALNVDVIDGATAMVQIFGSSQQLDVHKMIIAIESGIAILVFIGGIFLSIFATANLIPSMLEKGNIEILISKPLTRSEIFLGRYLGAQSIMILNVVYLIAGTWLILSIKTGFWYLPYLYSIPIIIITFAIIYALMAFVGLITRSTGVSVMVAYAVLFFSALLAPQKNKVYALLADKIYYYIIEGIYQAIPKTYELGKINFSLVRGQAIDGWSPLWSSGIVGAAMLLISLFVFSRKDY
jgi:ABC-type transport system involved in multi-copper enzyme maturation permease subunit